MKPQQLGMWSLTARAPERLHKEESLVIGFACNIKNPPKYVQEEYYLKKDVKVQTPIEVKSSPN